MSNGLILDLKQFNQLPTKEKFSCLYENQVETLNLVKGYKFHQKVQYILISLLIIGAGILLRMHLI